MSMSTPKWIREPLLHFVLLGAVVFGIYGVAAPDGPADDEIVVTRGQQRHIATTFERTWQRPPTPSEFQELVHEWIREEIAYREAQAMGLDTNDTIIRRRLRQKLEVLAEDVVSMVEPTAADLQAYLDAHRADYVEEPTYTLRHIYFSIDRRGEDAQRDAEQALALLTTGGELIDPEALGDPLPLPYRYAGERESALAARFGIEFAESLRGVQDGRWQGLVRSGYGLHLVFVEARTAGRPLTLEEAERAVRRDWANAQRVTAIDRLYDRLAEQYTITVEPFADEVGTGS